MVLPGSSHGQQKGPSGQYRSSPGAQAMLVPTRRRPRSWGSVTGRACCWPQRKSALLCWSPRLPPQPSPSLPAHGLAALPTEVAGLSLLTAVLVVWLIIKVMRAPQRT